MRYFIEITKEGERKDSAKRGGRTYSFTSFINNKNSSKDCTKWFSLSNKLEIPRYNRINELKNYYVKKRKNYLS